ncbi:family 45 putative glycoside hydrolase [Cercophora samala]|uniref:cellulase n=1 Tax=Cercophora samala TaxID=330535 RepID=A0AA39ZKD1_9PEZI|nr:family 45 putative glycoside hydrolase [Cercophora samala]
MLLFFHFLLLLFSNLRHNALANAQTVAKTYTGWDCCKPICAGTNNRPSLLDTRGAVRVCNKSNQPLSTNAGVSAVTGCQANVNTNNAAYLCDTYQPIPVSNDLSYGFAIQVQDSQAADHPNCCKCYQLQWLNGGAANKTMIVQVVTPGGAGGDVKRGDMIILTPGGGVGPLGAAGCNGMYGGGFNWGLAQGGVRSRQECERLPGNLWGGCYWRWNWAGGAVNGWDVVYQQVECPGRLVSISGCVA